MDKTSTALTAGGLVVVAVAITVAGSQVVRLESKIDTILRDQKQVLEELGMPTSVTSEVTGGVTGIVHKITTTKLDGETDAQFRARHVATCQEFQQNG